MFLFLIVFLVPTEIVSIFDLLDEWLRVDLHVMRQERERVGIGIAPARALLLPRLEVRLVIPSEF